MPCWGFLLPLEGGRVTAVVTSAPDPGARMVVAWTLLDVLDTSLIP